MKEYQKYVKEELWKEFEKHCKTNSLEFYGCGCVLTAHLVMSNLVGDEGSTLKTVPLKPKDAWNRAMEQTPYHSGFSAGCTAQIVSQFCVKGEEFRKWWNLDNQIRDEGEKANEKGGVLNPALLNIEV